MRPWQLPRSGRRQPSHKSCLEVDGGPMGYLGLCDRVCRHPSFFDDRRQNGGAWEGDAVRVNIASSSDRQATPANGIRLACPNWPDGVAARGANVEYGGGITERRRPYDDMQSLQAEDFGRSDDED